MYFCLYRQRGSSQRKCISWHIVRTTTPGTSHHTIFPFLPLPRLFLDLDLFPHTAYCTAVNVKRKNTPITLYVHFGASKKSLYMYCRVSILPLVPLDYVSILPLVPLHCVSILPLVPLDYVSIMPLVPLDNVSILPLMVAHLS